MAKIMIADDHLGIRFLYKELLTGMGHEVIAEADNGLDSLTLYGQLKPDLLIIDNHMEHMNGIDVVREIFGKNENPKIIMCTAKPNDILKEAIRIGVKKVIPKPFDTVTFVGFVSNVLSE